MICGAENGHAIEYTDGEGTLTFHYDSVIWDDSMENIAEGAVFTYCN